MLQNAAGTASSQFDTASAISKSLLVCTSSTAFRSSSRSTPLLMNGQWFSTRWKLISACLLVSDCLPPVSQTMISCFPVGNPPRRSVPCSLQGSNPTGILNRGCSQVSEALSKQPLSIITRNTGVCVQGIFNTLDRAGQLVEQTIEQLYSEAAGKFLADRFVTGTCPKCQYEVSHHCYGHCSVSTGLRFDGPR